MGRGAWWATVCGVTKSLTRLSDGSATIITALTFYGSLFSFSQAACIYIKANTFYQATLINLLF